jgi:CubicO group peptidase (beta-lactamase class C family)
MANRPMLSALGALFLFGQAPCLAQDPPTTTPLQAEQVEAIVQRAFERFAPVGIAVAVVQDGELLTEVARGQRQEGSPLSPASLFNIASCSKAFTAASVALLVQEGKLAWDDRVVDRIAEFKMADPWITAHMTISDLLSHRCGLVTFEGDLLWYGSDYDDAEVLRRIEKLPITQRFREEFGYQNLMYLVAGMVVQRVSGQSWEEFVERHFFAPLGMIHSRASAQRLPKDAEKAIPHIDGQAIPDHEFVACKPAAAIYSSVHELTNWVRMLLANGTFEGKRMLSPASIAEMWRPHVAMGGGSGAGTADMRGYGMGWFLSIERGNKLVEHDGGMPGFLSKVSLMPAEKFGFVTLNNSNDGILNEAIKRALLVARTGGDGIAVIDTLATRKKRFDQREAADRQKRESQRQEGTKPSLPLEKYAGHYEDPIYGPAEIELKDGALHVVFVPSKRRIFGTLAHWHFDTFRTDFPDKFLPFALIRFELDTTGAVVGFRVDCPIADFDFGALDFRRQAANH